MSRDNLYIDEVYIDTNGGSAFSGITNLLHGQSVSTNISTSIGFKWVVQITNGSGATINMSSTPIKVNICTDYRNDENEMSEYDYNIIINSGTIADGSNYYIGHDLFSGTITINRSDTNYLADQKSGSNIIAACRMRLYLDNTAIDVVGTNSDTNSNGYPNDSLAFAIFESTSDADGSIRRKPSVTSPATSYVSSDWQISTTNHLSASAVGDPHITTLNGEHYEFDYLGAFRLFENSTDENNIVINGLSEEGPGRWKKRQYIQKLYIQNNNKYILIDMGFRGTPVKVLESNGIEYNEEQLYFNKEARRYSFDSNYSTIDFDEPETDNLPALIRNEICFSIKDDKDNDILNNLQPCRLIISNIQKDLITKSRGALVHRKYAPVSKLDNIKNLEALENPSIEDLHNIPELEIDPKLKNIQWQ